VTEFFGRGELSITAVSGLFGRGALFSSAVSGVIRTPTADCSGMEGISTLIACKSQLYVRPEIEASNAESEIKFKAAL